MTVYDSTPVEPKADLLGTDDEAESIAEKYEEDAALTRGAADVDDLVVRVRKIEERLASIEDYLGTPPPKAESIEQRLEELET
jgi:hypothetical protein